MKNIKVNERFNRGVLLEGRSIGMGFAFLKKINDEQFDTVHATSTCKDYLNDIVFAEYSKKKVEAYGLKYSPLGLFSDSHSYIAMKILKSKTGGLYANFDKDTALLNKNYQNIQKLLNKVEERLGKERSEIFKAQDDYFVIKFSHWWSSKTYLISLYSLLIRMALEYDGSVEPFEYLNKYQKVGNEYSMWITVKLKLLLLFAGCEIEQNFDQELAGDSIHNNGIVSYNNFNL